MAVKDKLISNEVLKAVNDNMQGQVTDLKSALSTSLITTRMHNTAFEYGYIYYAPHTFIAGRDYRIDVVYDTPNEAYTSTDTNFSTITSAWLSSHNDSDIVETITGSSNLSNDVLDTINLVYHCNADSSGLAYYLGTTLHANTITISDITDIKPTKRYVKFPSNRNGTGATFSVELKEDVPYMLRVQNTNNSRKKLEFTAIDKIEFTQLERIFGGTVAAGTDAYYEFVPDDDWYLVVTSTVTSGLSWELYYDAEAYNKASGLFTKAEDLIGYKQIQTGKTSEGGSGFYAIPSVGFIKDKDYLINIKKPDGSDVQFTGLAFGSYNGAVNDRTMVDETITELPGINCGDNYYFKYTPNGNADNLLIYIANSPSAIAIIKVYTCTENDYYVNPVFKKRDTSDPTIFDGHDGYYYCMGSPWLATDYGMLRSADLIHWDNTGVYPFDSSVTELLATYTMGLWAPDFAYINGTYLMYISLVKNAQTSIIAVCKSRTPFGKYTLAGTIADSTLLNINDVIDPNVVIGDDGNTYMFFGSVGGVHRLKLADDGLSADGTPVHVAGTSDESSSRINVFEGSYLYYRNGYWYLFVSSGNFNLYSYALRVGRSSSISGTFTDKSGNNMTLGYAETLTFTASTDVFNGPGHNGLIFTDKTGKTYMFYHSHDVGSQYLFNTSLSNNIKSRMLFLQELKWDADGWPHFDDSKPINIDSRPVI